MQARLREALTMLKPGAGSVVWVTLSALALTLAFAHWRFTTDEGTRLLKALPDDIPASEELNSFAMSRGRPAFARYCASCHGSAGQPDTLRGVPDLRDHDWLYGSGRVEEIERVVLYGIRAGNSKGWDLASMPAFGTPNPYRRYPTPSLTPQEIGDVTDYIYSFQHSASDLDAVARGKHVFENQTRGLCWDCHSERGQGDSGIGAPNLRDRVWLYGDGSRRSIYASIVYGRGGSCPAWIGRLSPLTIVALAVYTHSLSQTASTKSREGLGHE
jgi:cytochrome c oxidase cbb3-type subunit 3